MYAAIGPWKWTAHEHIGSHWAGPAGAQPCVDLRAIADQGLSGTWANYPHTPWLFDTAANLAAAGSDYYGLGEGRLDELRPSGTAATEWKKFFGTAPTGDTVSDWIWHLLTDGSDPTGDTPSPTLTPSCGDMCELYLPGHSLVKLSKFGRWNPAGNAHHNRVRDRLRLDMKRIVRELRDDEKRLKDIEKQLRKEGKHKDADTVEAARNKLEDDKQSRKILGGYVKKYGCLPTEITNEFSPMLPATSLSENFTRADGEAIGNVYTWTPNVIGDFDTDTNAIEPDFNANALARAESDLSSDDMVAAIVGTFPVDGYQYWGGASRFAAAAATSYMGYLANNENSATTYKWVAGSGTSLGTTSSLSVVSTSRGGCRTDGSSISTELNTVTVDGPRTDTAITGNTRAGGYGYCTSGIRLYMDDWTAADLSAPPAASYWLWARQTGAQIIGGGVA